MTSLEQIQNTIEFLEGKITAATDDTDAKTSYEESLKLAQAVLQKSLKETTEENKPVIHSATNETYKRSLNIKSLENALNDVQTFKGIDIKETTQYIERLEKIFTIMVKEVDPNLEADYLKLVKVRLSDQVYKNMSTTNEEVSSFDEFKSWIKKNYGGKLNGFQLLQRAFSVEFRPEEKLTVYSQQVSEELRTALIAVKAQYSKNNQSAELTVDSLCEFFAGLLVTEKLREYCWPLYSQMVNDMDKLSTSSEIAQKGEFYKERLGGAFIGSQSDSYWVYQGSKSERKNKRHGTNPYPKRNDVKPKADSNNSGDWVNNQGWKPGKTWKTTPENAQNLHPKRSDQNPQRNDKSDAKEHKKKQKKETGKKSSLHTVSSKNATSESVPSSIFTPSVTPFQ